MMRLRLVIQRHGIPPVQILWTVAATRPPLAAAGSSITVSQFLEQVNDIIPLESEDWGLEDYAVEVGGYECLHFSELAQVLKNDEEVCIRALQTNDIRIRKISGRHQISADGKHLIDGVAFGRPYLRRVDRPAVRLPPRKRRRITYEEEEEDIGDGDEVNNRQVVVRAGFDAGNEAVAEDESDDEESFVPDDDEDEDMSAELEDLQDDLQAGANDDGGASFADKKADTPSITARRSRRSPKGLGLLHLLDENGRPFPGEYSNPLLDKYGQDEPILKVRKRGTARLAQGARKSARNGILDSSASPERVSRRASAGSNKSVRFEDDELATPATIQVSVDSEEDDDFELGEVGESDKENAEPRAEDIDSSGESSESSASSSSNPLEEVESDETSPLGSSSSDSSSESDSDSEPDQASTKAPGRKSDSSDTSSSGSSSSSSDPEPESRQKVASSKPKEKPQPTGTPRDTKQVPPGEGKKRTRKRNDRRHKRRRLEHLKREGFLGVEATMTDLHNLEKGPMPENTHLEDVEMQDDLSNKAAADIEFEVKRQALLMDLRGDSKTKEIWVEEAGSRPNLEDTFAEAGREAKRQKLMTLAGAGGIEADRRIGSQVRSVGTATTDEKPVEAEGASHNVSSTRTETLIDASTSPRAWTTEAEPTVNAPKGPDISVTQDEPTTDASTKAVATKRVEEKDAFGDRPVETGDPALRSASKETPTPSSQHRRSKLDLGGAKRMLFGSLGLRTPKSKQDESKTREILMKDVRPVKEPQLNKEGKTAEDLAVIAADDSWKDKIDLRAVECCHEGIELSTPPFPFVQRWDPQQQGDYNYGNAKKRKNKKRKRNNDSYYKESSNQDSRYQSPLHGEYEAAEGDSYLPHATSIPEDQKQERSPEGSLQDSQAVSEQLLRETGEVSAGTLTGNDELSTDLPNLPEDPTTCPPLTREIAKKGAVIAFKQLEMSAETNWQPNISNYRTAIVDQMTENGDLCMTPAKRDRRNKPADYDERTGERLYSKFEMPGFDDEDDNATLEISFDELIGPILLRAVDSQAIEGSKEQGKGEDHTSAQDRTSSMVSAQLGRDTTDQQTSSLDGAADEIMEDQTVEPSPEARGEISELIKEAGWRSSVQSGVNGGLKALENSTLPEREDGREHTTLTDPPSPRFNGFSSSPVINVRSSPPILESQPAKRLHASGTEIAESVPPQDPVDPDAKSVVSESRSAVGYPSLPQLGDDSELYHEEAQHRSDPLFDHEILSQDLISNSMDQSPAQSTRSRTRPSQDSSPPKPSQTIDVTGSEDEFPEPFSQAWENRMSQAKDIKPESSQGDAISPPSYRGIRANGRHSSSERESNGTWKPDGDWSALENDDEDDSASTPRPLKSQMSSQIVDLTMSSDTVDPMDSPHNGDDDSYKLPKGPGWVSKTRASRERSAPTRIKPGKSKARSG